MGTVNLENSNERTSALQDNQSVGFDLRNSSNCKHDTGPRRYASHLSGGGQLTALTYVLTLGSKERFERSRDVGCYLGLRPRRSQSGDHDMQFGITKAGNIYLRSLLVECANHVLGPHGRDSTLRQWGLHLASRGGKQSRNRAIVAVARKLAVLLHRIWVTQEPYIPFYAEAA